jgi:hypothetical protein
LSHMTTTAFCRRPRSPRRPSAFFAYKPLMGISRISGQAALAYTSPKQPPNRWPYLRVMCISRFYAK